jgi:transglutaminase-like putative cysteine protease
MAAQRQSSFVALSRASLTAGAALALTRVFGGSGWIGALAIAAFLPAAIFAIAERRRWHWLAAPLLTLVVGLWLAVLVDSPSETVAGLPGPGALSTFRADLADAPHVLRSATVPVTPIGAALVLALVATLVCALATELIARRLDAPLGAIGPSVALFVAVCALGSGRWAPTTAIYAAVVLLYLMALQHADMTARRTWFQSTSARRSQYAAGGLIAGVIIVALAIVFGPLFPGARGDAWINYRSLGAGKGASVLNTPSPLVSISTKLEGQNSDRQVFSVKTSNKQGYYWRVIALDTIVRGDWSMNADRKSVSNLEGPDGLPGSTRVEQNFTLGPIDPYWLPAAYRPIDIDLDDANVLPGSASLFLNGNLNNSRYQVVSEIASPSAERLADIEFSDLATQEELTDLPDNFSGRARDLADEVTAGKSKPYEIAAELEAYFQTKGNFVYDQSVDLRSSTRAIDTFLFDTKRGFCEQFAAAFAELARHKGLPTRIAVGYQQGTYDEKTSEWKVKEKDAHAWPEVWLGDEIGWYAFEPTPSRFNGTNGRGDPAAANQPAEENPAQSTTTTPGTTPATTPGSTPNSVAPPGQVNVNPDPAAESKPRSTGAKILTALVVAVVLLIVLAAILVTVLVIRTARRTKHRRTDPDARRRVLGAWTEALERLTAAGVARRPSATSLEFALRQAPADGAGDAGPPLMDLARLHTAALYAPEPPTEADADQAWQYVDTIDAAVKARVGRVERWKNRIQAMRHDRPDRDAEPDDAEAVEEIDPRAPVPVS